MEYILKYFGNLTRRQIEQFSALKDIYEFWNERINVISRKDIQNLYLHHIVHSLAIAKFMQFHPGTVVLDIGTGGGFPGIPLAIMFPGSHFTLIDSTAKKLRVVNEVVEATGLENVRTIHTRAEQLKEKFEFVLSRAVADLEYMTKLMMALRSTKMRNVMPNGLIALKGGNLDLEIKKVSKITYSEVVSVSNFFEEDYFENKFVVYVQG